MSEMEPLKCSPICTVNDLFKWNNTSCRTTLKSISQDSYTSIGGGKFEKRNSKNVPKTLVCHDMKGGYLDDSYLAGSPNSDAYCFTQWNLIDTFVYFSHHFVTIPPPCWIHAAHLHGVPVLGTVITEWDQGSAICKEIFSSKSAVENLVWKLVDITRFHNFDGWLINIENPLEEEWVENVVFFLSELKKTMTVIWYDSVTKEGKLDWQNELNDHNRIFFEACDGVFLNYTWNVDNLSLSASNAGDRILDVYVGVDVFGRNCYGGGGFNTSSALSVIRQNGLSAAIFAPGWIYETHPVEQFHELSSKFWLSLLPDLNIHDLMIELPMETSFCPGHGKLLFRNGQIVENEGWHNMSKQQLQPYLAAVDGLQPIDVSSSPFFESRIFNELSSVIKKSKFGSSLVFGLQSICTNDAYNGGGCLLLQGPESAIFPLFLFSIALECHLRITIIYKAVELDELYLLLSIEERRTGNAYTISCSFVRSSLEEIDANDTTNVSIQLLSGQDEQQTDHSTKQPDEWQKRSFQIVTKGEPDASIRAINLHSKGALHLKIGYFQTSDVHDLKNDQCCP